MVKSIKQFRAENKKLKAKVKARGELIKLEKERVELAVKNKLLLKQISRSPSQKAAVRVLRKVGRGAFRGTFLVGKGTFKVGKSIGKGLMNYGQFLDRQQRAQEKRVKTLKKIVKRKR